MYSNVTAVKSINNSSNSDSLAGFFAYHAAKNYYKTNDIKSFEEEIEEHLYQLIEDGAHFSFGNAFDIAINLHIRNIQTGE